MKLFMTTAGLLFASTLISAQTKPSGSPVPEANRITLTNQQVLTGDIGDHIRKKGEITLVADGKKQRFKAADILEARIGNTRYISSNFTFFEVLAENRQFQLLRKANQPSDIQYNGTNPIVINSEGKIDDLFLKGPYGRLHLLSPKNWKEVLGTNCTVDDPAASFGVETIRRILDSCK